MVRPFGRWDSLFTKDINGNIARVNKFYEYMSFFRIVSVATDKILRLNSNRA